MKVLVLAPQPFYQERGTPIAVDLVVRTLSGRGDTVDVLTFPEGEPVNYPGVRLIRIARIPGLWSIGPGPSFKKAIYDAVMLVAALRLAARSRYDMVHGVEEAAFMGLLIKWLMGIAFIYDMDSCLSEQLIAKYPALRVLGPLLRGSEGFAMRRADAVVAVCDALAETATKQRARKVVLLRDVPLTSLQGAVPFAEEGRHSRRFGGPVAMYVGNLERYQGIDLLLRSFTIAKRQVPSAHLVVIGGQPEAIARYERLASALGVSSNAHFLGSQPIARLEEYFNVADVLVSPRLEGRNTPMKIYSYLDSGKPILATDLPMHTQLLTEGVALLRRPVPEAFAEGLVRLWRDPHLRRRLGRAGRILIENRHSYRTYQQTLTTLYAELEAGVTS